MGITLKELKRISQLCFVSFSDSVLERIKNEIKDTFGDEIIFQADDNKVENQTEKVKGQTENETKINY